MDIDPSKSFAVSTATGCTQAAATKHHIHLVRHDIIGSGDYLVYAIDTIRIVLFAEELSYQMGIPFGGNLLYCRRTFLSASEQTTDKCLLMLNGLNVFLMIHNSL